MLAVYAPSLRHDFVYDDFEVILQQEPLRSPADLLHVFLEPHGLPSSQLPYYRAVPRATLLLQKTLQGDVPWPFHLGNALLAAAAGIVAFALLRLPVFGTALPVAWLAAALFAVHPVASSVVYPIASGRETLLPGACWLVAVWGYLRGGPGGRALACGAFALALLGKEQAIALPGLFVLADALRLTPDPPGARLGRWIVRFAPVGLVVLLYLALRGFVMPPPGDVDLLSALRLQPLGPIYSLLYSMQIVLTPFRGLVYEPALAVWWSPLRLLVAVSVMTGLALMLALRSAGDRRILVFWIGWALLSLALTANFFPQETPFDDRFVFLASLAPIAMAARLATELWPEPRHRPAVLLAGGVLLLLAAGITVGRGAAFVDPVSFGRQWVRTNPLQANARFTLGTALAREGADDEALGHLEESVRLAPGYAAARYNLAVVLAHLGRLDEAAEQLEALAALVPADPEPHAMLATIRERQGRSTEARTHAGEAERRAAVRR